MGMGLDNGIIVRMHEPAEEEEICYWRKCWGLRDSIIEMLTKNGRDVVQKEVSIDVDDIINIVNILQQFDDEDYWVEHGDSIWSYEDIKDDLHNQIDNLMGLLDALNGPNNIKDVRFYDSY